MARSHGRYVLASGPAAAQPAAHAPVSVAEVAHQRLAPPATVAAEAAGALGVTVTPVRPGRGAGRTLRDRGVWRGAQNSGSWRSAEVSRDDPGASRARLQPSYSHSHSRRFLAWGNPCGGGENMLGLAITSQAKTRQYARYQYCFQRPLRNRPWLNAATSVARDRATATPSATPTTL